MGSKRAAPPGGASPLPPVLPSSTTKTAAVPSSPPPPILNDPEPNVAPHEAVKAAGGGLRESTTRKKNSGLIRLIGAPKIDIKQAERMIQEESEPDHPEEALPEGRKGHQAAVKNDEVTDIESPRVPGAQDSEYLDAANEETFTLESFEGLIRTARANNKAFILARVTTVDPSNLAHLYFSYYAAHHINRVIFRTQPEEGLLHRMKSRNPLNNMLIVGDVHYFIITPEDFDQAWSLRQLQTEQQNVLRSSTAGAGAAATTTASGSTRAGGVTGSGALPRVSSWNHHRRSVSESQQKPLPWAVPVSNNNNNSSSTSLPEMSQLRSEVDLSVLNEMEREGNIPPIYEAKYFASDDDFLMDAQVREYFKLNSVNPDDYQLFQLNRRSDLPYDLTVLGPDGRPLSHGSNSMGTRQHQATARNLWGFLDDTDHESMVGLPTAYLSPLGFWLLAILATVAIVIVSILYLQLTMQLLALGGAIVLFSIIVLFFVRWER